MNYGQIIYHLEDYYNHGGIISTKTDGTVGIIPSLGQGGTDDSINVFESLVESGTTWDKIGIQAPPGIEFIIDEQPYIMGPSGTFELTGVNISSFKFKELKNYSIDKNASKLAIESGRTMMQNALDKYNGLTQNLILDENTTDNFKDITEQYFVEYETGYALYKSGKNGIYNEDETNKILMNIIVDYRIGGETDDN